MAGNVAGLVADAEFQKLSPADQRTALLGVSGDKMFSQLDDAGTVKFIQGIRARTTEVQGPLAPPAFKPSASTVNVQPMSLSQTINAATGHENYQPQPITPQGIAKGTAQDLWTLTKAGPQAIANVPSQITHNQRIAWPLGKPDIPQVISAGKNIGQGMLLGAVEGGGVRPRIGKVPQPPAEVAPPAPPEGVLTPAQEAVNARYVAEHPVGGSPYQRPNLTPEQQAEYTARIDKANADTVKYQQAQDLAARQQQQASVIQQQVKAKNAEVYGGLSQRADAFREASAQVTRPITNIEKSIEQARTDLSGTPGDLRIFNQVMDHLQTNALEPQAQEFAARLGRGMTEETAAAQALPPSAEVPLIDLQRQYTALSNQWADATGNVKRVLGDVRNVYQRELQAGADSIGRGNEWRGLQKDFSQYYKDWTGTSPLAKVLKAQHPDYVTPQVIGRPGNLLRETYAKYGDPSEIARLQQIANPPPPPPTPVEPPLPEPVKQGFLKKHVLPRAGGLAAAEANLPVPGHFIINYEAGKAGTQALINRLSRRMPPTPEAYTRTLLEAKEGKISPGEADRRIARAGGRVKIRPIPRSPQERERVP